MRAHLPHSIIVFLPAVYIAFSSLTRDVRVVRLQIVQLFMILRLLVFCLAFLVVGGDWSCAYAAPGRNKRARTAAQIRTEMKRTYTPRKMRDALKKILDGTDVPASIQQQMTAKRLLIENNTGVSPFDAVFNQLMAEVYMGQRHPEDVRINGHSMLWFAVEKGMLDCAKYLIEEKRADTSVFCNGESLICRAARSGNKDLVEYLEKEQHLFLNDPRCRAQWKGACGILKRAMQSGNRDCIEYIYERLKPLIPSNPNAITLIDSTGFSGDDKIMEWVESLGWPFRRNEILLRAAVVPDVTVLRYMETRGAQFDYVGTAGYTPLMTAALGGNTDCVHFVLNKMKDDKARTAAVRRVAETGDTALDLAALSGEVGVIGRLLELDPKFKYEEDYTGCIFENAVASGSLNMLAKVISLTSAQPVHINRALCAAARFGQLEMVRKLVSNYMAAVNASSIIRIRHSFPYEDMVGRKGTLEVAETTPLIAAIAGGNMGVFRFLVDNNADLTASIGNGDSLMTPLRAAARSGQPDMLNYLIIATRAYENPDPAVLNLAAANGNLACVRLLVESGWDVNAPDPETGLYAIQAACIRGSDAPGANNWNYDSGSMHAACVAYLLENGADASGEIGRRAKALALHDEVPLFECASLLWDKGSALSIDEMRYPLHRAAELGRHRWVKELLPGLKSRLESDERNTVLFTLSLVRDSHVPYEEAPANSDYSHGKCLRHLRPVAAPLTPEQKNYLRRNQITLELK